MIIIATATATCIQGDLVKATATLPTDLLRVSLNTNEVITMIHICVGAGYFPGVTNVYNKL